MVYKRIVPCLDIKDGRVVKGVRFQDLRVMGDPVEMARYYDKAGADELVLLDIAASEEGRKTMLDVVASVAEAISIPFTVGGGIGTLADMRAVIGRGADKVSINTAAVLNPSLISEGAKVFGSQCVVLAVDTKRVNGRTEVFTHGGKESTGMDAFKWIKEAVALGAGEILITSMDSDGERSGYDEAFLKAVTDAVRVPIIASGGCGDKRHILSVFENTGVSAALVASLFHEKSEGTLYRESPDSVKAYLKAKGVLVRKPSLWPNFNKGLVTAVVQNASSKEVLMVAHMNEEAFLKTLESTFATFYSRSRASLWEKGLTSGNRMQLVSLAVDCDRDAVLLGVMPWGPACHTGQSSCFFNRLWT